MVLVIWYMLKALIYSVALLMALKYVLMLNAQIGSSSVFVLVLLVGIIIMQNKVIKDLNTELKR